MLEEPLREFSLRSMSGDYKPLKVKKASPEIGSGDA